MGERRVLVVIDPPEHGLCVTGGGQCQHYDAPYCRVGFDRVRFSDARPAACIAAEAEVAALQGGIIARVQEIADGLWPNGTDKRDRVADALAAVLGTEPVEL